MKKLILAATLAVATFFGAQAQIGAHVNIMKSMDEGAEGIGIGVDGVYLINSGALSFGPELGYSTVVGGTEGVSSSTIWYQAVGRYYVGGDAEAGGFYPQLNVGLATSKSSVDFLGTSISVSSTNLQYGLGAGYKLESGFDIAARYNIVSFEGGSSKGLVIQVGMFF